MNTQLNQKEQQVLVTEIVDACIKYCKENYLEFAEVLTEQVFANKADAEFTEMVCKTIETLHAQGYLNGTVELEYELEFDAETLEESSTDKIDSGMSTFADISITPKGKELMGEKTFQELGKSFLEKAKPAIKCIATTAFQATVETAVCVALKAVGFSV